MSCRARRKLEAGAAERHVLVFPRGRKRGKPKKKNENIVFTFLRAEGVASVACRRGHDVASPSLTLPHRSVYETRTCPTERQPEGHWSNLTLGYVSFQSRVEKSARDPFPDEPSFACFCFFFGGFWGIRGSTSACLRNGCCSSRASGWPIFQHNNLLVDFSTQSAKIVSAPCACDKACHQPSCPRR